MPQHLPEEVFETMLSNGSIKIERIISKGHASPEDFWYDQEFSEWVLLLRGKASLAFDNAEEIVLEPGDYLNIPAHARHRVLWTSPDEESVWLSVHY